MCIFFSLCNTSLCHVVCCQKFTECICDFFFYKCYLLILDRHIILCKAYKCCLDSLSSVKSFKVIITECSCDFSCTVWAEVEEDHRISIFYSCHRCTVFYDYHWFYELICLICIVRSLDPCCRRFCLYAFSFYQCIVSSLHTIPAVISVHCIVTSADRCHFSDADLFHFCFQSFYIIFSGCRRSVTSVQETVYIHFFYTLSLCKLQKSVNMSVMAVYTTVRNQSHHMKSCIVLFCIFACCKQRLILKEISVFDRFCNLCQFLVNDASCSHVQMSYLRVSHLTFRKSDCHSTCISFYKRILCHQFIHDRSLSFCHSISFCCIIQSISI